MITPLRHAGTTALLLLSSAGAFAQTTLQQESFETDGEGTRYTSTTFDLRPSGTNAQYFLREDNPVQTPTGTPTFGSTAIPVTIGNVNGTFFWACEGVRGQSLPPARAAQTVTLNPINISGYNNLLVKVMLAEARGPNRPNAGSLLGLQWENDDFVRIKVSIDGGAFTTIGQFVGDNPTPSTGGNLRQDTNLNGISSDDGGTIVDVNLQDFTFSVSGTGTTMQVQVEVDQIGGTEELAFDNIRLLGTAAANNPPVINPQTFGVAENSGGGTFVGTVAASDPDAGQSLTYSIIGGNTGNAFTMIGNQLFVNGGATLDFEAIPSYALTVQVTDNGSSPQSTSATVTVDLTNVNESPSIGDQSFGVAENAANGTVVGTVNAFDPDAGTTLTYSITGGNTGGAFGFVGNQLRVTNVAALDFEATPSFSLTVLVSDGGLTASATVTVNLIDANEPPVINNQSFGVAENAANGTIVGTVNAFDPDAGTTLTYSITGGNTGGAFGFVGNQLRVTNAAALDFEATPSFSLTVLVSDGGLTASATVTVNLTDQNEGPTDIALSNDVIAENTGNNVVVGLLSTTDPDAGSTFTYSLVSGVGSADNALVNINGNELRITTSPDFEAKNSYAVRVQSMDNGGLTTEKAFVITITDVVEGPTNSAPTNISLSNASVAENAANAVVGNLSTTDADAGDTFTYALVSGTGSSGNGAFQIVGNVLRTISGLDFETQNTYSVRISTTDNGTPNLSFEKVFTISVTDQPEDLIVSTSQAVAGGNYNNITVTGTGVATLAGAVNVQGALVVQTGGVLNTVCQNITGTGSFTLQSGAMLRICDPVGISLSEGSGAVQVSGPRSFSTDAVYVYNGSVPQLTGTGLPATVRELEAANAAGVTLSQAVAVTQALRLTAGTLATNAKVLTLRSTATQTAYAVHAGGSTSGNVTVQRFVGGPAGLGYRHLSAPVQNTTVADLTTTGFTPVVNGAYNTAAKPLNVKPYPTVLGLDESRKPTSALFIDAYFSPTALSNTLTLGRAWSVYMNSNLTPDFVGSLYSGDLTMSGLTKTGNFTAVTEKSGWHLLGNPYAQPIDWDLATIPGGMSNSISVYRTTGGQNGQYLTYANGIGTLPDGIVPVGQGFMARVTGASPVDFTFTNALRVEANPATVARPAADRRPQVRLALTGATGTDETVVYVQDGAALGQDAGFDGLRPARNDGMPTLATVIEGEEAAVNGLPESVLTSETLVDLTAVLPTPGRYTLSVATAQHWGTTPLALLDRKTNTRYDLGQPLTLTTTQSNEEVAGRFALVIGTARPGAQLSNLMLWPNPATGKVQVSGAEGLIELLDATGRVIRTTTATAATTQLDLNNLPTGVYVVRNGATSRRLVVE